MSVGVAASSTDRENEAAYRPELLTVQHYTTVLRGHLPELRPESWILQSRRPRSSAQRLRPPLMPTYHDDIAALTAVCLARASGSEAELCIVDYTCCCCC